MYVNKMVVFLNLVNASAMFDAELFEYIIFSHLVLGLLHIL